MKNEFYGCVLMREMDLKKKLVLIKIAQHYSSISIIENSSSFSQVILNPSQMHFAFLILILINITITVEQW